MLNLYKSVADQGLLYAPTHFRYQEQYCRDLTVTCINAMKMLLCAPRFYNAGHTSDSINVPTCQAVIRNLMYKCMCRLDKVESRITNAATRSCTCYTSKI